MAKYASKKAVFTGMLTSNIFKASQEYTQKPYCANVVFEDNEVQKAAQVKAEVLKEGLEGKKRDVDNKGFMIIGKNDEYTHSYGKAFSNFRSAQPFNCYLRVNGELKKLSKEEATQYFYPGAIIAISAEVVYRPDFIRNGAKISEHVGSSVIALLFVRHGERLSTSVVVDKNDFAGIESDIPVENLIASNSNDQIFTFDV